MHFSIPARTTLAFAAALFAATAAAFASPLIAQSFSPMPAYLPALHRGEADRPHATPMPERPETTAVPVVVMSGPVDPAAWTVDAYTIQKVEIDGDRLAITVRHGGGCRTHDFHLVTSRLFMESSPVQSDLLLTHDGHGDLCRALVTAELVFDLGPLKRTYQHVYPNAPGPIILRLRDWAEPVRYEF